MADGDIPLSDYHKALRGRSILFVTVSSNTTRTVLDDGSSGFKLWPLVQEP